MLNEQDSQCLDEWLAVKTDNKYKLNDLLNIVSLSVELEKITIVTREHNRRVTDDTNTKQWYGIYDVKQLYLIHQQICQIDADLDKYYPVQLKPIKGYLSTYFNNDLKKSICPNKTTDSKTIDLQDNILCNSIKVYLQKCIDSIGVSLFVDILFNDLSSNDYFEVYSEFNLKRLQTEIDKLKQMFRKLRQKETRKKPQIVNDVNNEDFLWEFKRTVLKIFEIYLSEDKLLNNLLLVYAEYYNNLLTPMIDSRELAKTNLARYNKKLENQMRTNKYFSGQSSVDALKELEEIVTRTESDVYELSNDIDNLCIEYKQNVIEIYESIHENIKNDKMKFLLPKNNPFYYFFEFVIKERVKRVENEILDKRIQFLNIQLKSYERNLEYINFDETNQQQIKDLKIKIIKQKLKIFTEEENLLKKSLNEFKSTTELAVDPQVADLAKQFGQEYLDELKEKYKIETSQLTKIEFEKPKCTIESFETDEDDYLSDDTKFFDAYETPDKIYEEENKKLVEKNNKINSIKKKILNLGSKKSNLRLALKKLEEPEKLPVIDETPSQPVIKTFTMKKEEDKIQKQMYMENRNKALQRLREYKMKKLKESGFGSTDSLCSVKTNFTDSSVRTVIKKPYVPKSKQRILPPGFGKKIKSEDNSSLNNIELCQDVSPPVPPPLPPSLTAPPPPPVPIDLFKPSIAPPPPPPPPPPLLLLEPVKKVIEKKPDKQKENVKIEFDINEIKTFKFKKSNKSRLAKERPPTNQFNSWDSLMNEIRTNGGRNLRNITNEDVCIKQSKCDLNLPHKSKLEWDLNLILSQRSKFFNADEDDDDDDSASDASWNAYIEN